MLSDSARIEQIIDEINAKNCKKIAFFMVIGFAICHSILHLQYGTNSCRWLLSNGRYKGDQQWQPYGCMLHLYTEIDTRRCLRYIAFYGSQTSFVFIGDSRIKQLYSGLVNHLKQKEDSTQTPENYHMNSSYSDDKLNIKVKFLWAPTISMEMLNYFRNLESSTEENPSVIITGSALWPIINSNGSTSGIEQYKINITRLVKYIDGLTEKKCKVLWTIQTPVEQEKLPLYKQAINNNLIDLYNRAAVEILTYSKVNLWWSTRLIGQGMIAESLDGIHLPKKPIIHNTQILLNMYCNDYMNFNDGTCCSSVESYTILQFVTFGILGICVLLTSIFTVYKLMLKRREPLRYDLINELNAEPVSSTDYTLLHLLIKLLVIMVYFFICDRTNFFMKENKYYSEFSFWLPIGYLVVLGLFFTEDSKFTKVLHRDQLNELKGWIQVVILVYHLTGANRILMINMHVKVLLSTYLFLLSYEQFMYMWHRSDTSIVNFFRNLFQLNFMTVTLCLCMNRPYQFYYFSPVLSFWYIMLYCFFTFPPQITAQSSENNFIQYFYLLIKFIILFIIITILFMSEVFFEKVFVTRPWKAFFVTVDDDIRDWWYRWKLDRYTVIYGMSFSVLLILGQKFNIYDDNSQSSIFSKRVAVGATLAAVFGLATYTSIVYLCRNELECSEIHSYVAFIPIISFILLRNIAGFVRCRYSTFFAWFGEIYLELFLSQYHIWLAADNHGVLVLLPGYPVLNLIITTFIFVCASHEMHHITMSLLPYAVPNDWKFVLRNCILFLVILVPIGVNDGMF